MSNKKKQTAKGKLTHQHAKKLTNSLPDLHPEFVKVLENAGHKGYKVVSFTVAKEDVAGAPGSASLGGCHVNEDGTITC